MRGGAMTEQQTITIVRMDGVFGEGITAVAATPREAVAALRREYLACRDAYHLQRGETEWFSFVEAASYFSVTVQVVPLGTAWMDGRSEGGYREPAEYITGYDG